MDYINNQFLQRQDELLYFVLTSLVNEAQILLKDTYDNPTNGYCLKEISFVPNRRNDKFDVRFSFSHPNQSYALTPLGLGSYANQENVKKMKSMQDLLDINISEDLPTLLNVFFNKRKDSESFSLTYPDNENKNLRKFLGNKFFTRYEKEYLEKQINPLNSEQEKNDKNNSKSKKLKV